MRLNRRPGQIGRRLPLAAWALLLAGQAAAGDGKLLATGGATPIEGSAGGGLSPWAVLAGYGTGDQNGAVAFATRLQTADYALNVYGAGYTIRNRVELSYARQRLDLGELQRRLSLPTGGFRQDVYGVKVRLAGDVVYGTLPQVSVGIQHKRQLDFAVPQAVGAIDDSGTDVYVSATKLLLAGAAGRHLLLNGTVRSTRANQAGLLGFGGDRKRGRSLVWEGTAAVMLNPRWGAGLEYRQKPDNLGFAHESDWKDAFVAWFPSKHVSLVGAWVDLGSVASLDDQQGPYLSMQVAY